MFLGVDQLPIKQHFGFVKTVTLKMDRKQIALLGERAKILRRSSAAIVRELIDEHLGGKKRPTLYEQAKDICGSVRGSKDLSTRSVTHLGRD
jgi:hypothetical protein